MGQLLARKQTTCLWGVGGGGGVTCACGLVLFLQEGAGQFSNQLHTTEIVVQSDS